MAYNLTTRILSSKICFWAGSDKNAKYSSTKIFRLYSNEDTVRLIVRACNMVLICLTIVLLCVVVIWRVQRSTCNMLHTEYIIYLHINKDSRNNKAHITFLLILKSTKWSRDTRCTLLFLLSLLLCCLYYYRFYACFQPYFIVRRENLVFGL